eukprot:1303472-Ditylum_brightwellii.AAC.1
MVWQKGEPWVATGDPIFCPLKPMQWLQGSQASPMHKRGEACRYLPLGGGWGNKQDVFLVVAATVIF